MKKKIIYAFFIFLFLCGLAYATAIVSINGNPIGSIVSINGNAVSGIHDIDGNTITHGTCTASFSPSFGNVTGLPISTLETSTNTTVTLTNCSTATASISGNSGQMKDFTANIDWGTSNITISNGDIIGVRQTTSGSYFTSTTTTLTVASVANASLMQTILDVPSSVSATAGVGNITWGWTNSTGQTNTWLEWGATNSLGNEIQNIGSTPYVQTGLPANVTVYGCIKSEDSNNNLSDCSNIISATPTAPVTNFLNDANIIAAYSFENNLNDSSSHGLTLTAGTDSYNTTTDVQWGIYSLNITGTHPCYVSNSIVPGHASYTGLTAFSWINWSSADTNTPNIIVGITNSNAAQLGRLKKSVV